MRSFIFGKAFFFFACLGPAGLARACANCYIPGNSQPSLFYSGLILLPFPFLLVGLLIWAVRKFAKTDWEKDDSSAAEKTPL